MGKTGEVYSFISLYIDWRTKDQKYFLHLKEMLGNFLVIHSRQLQDGLSGLSFNKYYVCAPEKNTVLL